MTNAVLRGKPDAGNPHVRFDEGEVASAKPRRGSLLYKASLIVTSFGVSLAASAWAAIPTGAGPYKWDDYLSKTGGRADARPEQALTADQTWIVETDRTGNPFYPGVQTLSDYWQIWTGASVTSLSGNGFRVMKGNVVFENAVISQTTENYIGYTGPVRLVLRNGGSFLATAAGVNVGRSYNGGTAGTATVFLEKPSSFAVSGQWLSIGATLPGAVWMDGGTLSMTNGCLWIGDGYGGYLRLNGGEVSLRSENSDQLYVGCPHYGSIHVAGGRLTARNASYATERFIKVGRDANTRADVYADGGEIDLPNGRFSLGQWSSGVAGLATLTVDGTADVHLGLLAMGTTGTLGTSVLNLNGGRFQLVKGLANYGNTFCRRWINFDGGTLASMLDIAWPTVVYPGGGTIHVASSKNRIPLPFCAAKGYGVKSVELTSAGSGYVTAPCVTITGGSGSNATAYAVLNKDRTLEKIVVTCRGEGYAENDQLTVTLDSTTGSGAAATVTLGENGTGTLHKTGAGVWQQTVDSAFDGDISVDEGTLAVDGVALTNLKHLYVRNEASLNAGRSLNTTDVRASSVNRLDVKDGIAQIGKYGDSGRAKLSIGELNIDRGLLLVSLTNDLELALMDATPTATSASASPIVNGMVYRNGDSSTYRSPTLFERGEDGSLSLITTTATAANDANFCPLASNTSGEAPEIASLNCAILTLSPAVEYYLKNTGLLEIKSGMIVCRRPHECVARLEVTGGGAFTTRAPGGMMIYSDMYQVSRRSYSSAHDNVVNVGNWRRLYGPFADPDSSTPMSLTIAGERQSRPELGAVAWLLNKSSFSGGVNLVNGGVVIASESSLGTSGKVTAVGNCSITAYNHTFALSDKHPIEICKDANLIFCPINGNQGNTVAAKLTGEGTLLTSDIDRSGYAMAYTGDHSDFAGAYYVMGHARISPETFSPIAALCLADGTNGVGVIETSGSFTRPLGTGKGEICWARHATMPKAYGLRGGFAAVGGDLTVNLGGGGAALVPASDYLPEGAVIQLQSQYADGELTVENGLDLAGRTQEVSVWAGKMAKWTGGLKDSLGGGTLKVTGGGTFAFGGTLKAKIGPDGFEGHPIAVDGDLTIGGATVELDATAADLKRLSGQTIPLVSVTGTISGQFERATSDPRWIVRTRAHGVELAERMGLSLVVR